jgi:hypothetical protein
MRTLFMIVVMAGALCLVAVGSLAQTRSAAVGARTADPEPQMQAPRCGDCGAKPPRDSVSAKPIPGTNETMVIGPIENLIPIGVVAVLGCETCAGEAVAWALQQGSSPEDIDRALRTIESMQKLDCFTKQFGPDAVARIDKPLAAARRVLQQAIERGGT